MSRLEDNFYYKMILNKIKDGTFVPGKGAGLTESYLPGKSIKDYPMEERTPEICASLIEHSTCKFSDVPQSARTREFFISRFTDTDVFKYIRHRIKDFDRDFFKDLIASNKYSVTLPINNCFQIMPVDYIDEEMCSLAILVAKEWSNDKWFFTVAQRKPEALSSVLWHLGARLYASVDKEGKNKFLEMAPDEVKDEAFYLEMCGCTYGCNMPVTACKRKITDSFPEGVITPDFVFSALFNDLSTVERMGESALETEVTYNAWYGLVTEKAWQIAVKNSGRLISGIELNDERVEFFLSHYPKTSGEYIHSFQEKYRRYLAKKKDGTAYEQTIQRTQNITEALRSVTIGSAQLLADAGLNPADAKDIINNATQMKSLSFLPIRYQGPVPDEFKQTHDSEEYLTFVYKALGIEVIEEFDDMFYKVKVPDGWSLIQKGNRYGLYDENNVCILVYTYFTIWLAREAYVDSIEVDIDLSEGSPRKRKYSPKKKDE